MDSFEVIEDLEVLDPEVDSVHFIAILVKCLALLDKLPLAVNVRKIINCIASFCF